MREGGVLGKTVRQQDGFRIEKIVPVQVEHCQGAIAPERL